MGIENVAQDDEQRATVTFDDEARFEMKEVVEKRQSQIN